MSTNKRLRSPIPSTSDEPLNKVAKKQEEGFAFLHHSQNIVYITFKILISITRNFIFIKMVFVTCFRTTLVISK